jgi:hypothetical protein
LGARSCKKKQLNHIPRVLNLLPLLPQVCEDIGTLLLRFECDMLAVLEPASSSVAVPARRLVPYGSSADDGPTGLPPAPPSKSNRLNCACRSLDNFLYRNSSDFADFIRAWYDRSWHPLNFDVHLRYLRVQKPHIGSSRITHHLIGLIQLHLNSRLALLCSAA